jgi:hypothetical protein
MKNIENASYEELKKYYDEVLNKDQSTFHTSNDEPTPIGCIEEMLTPIPSTFWKRKNLSFFDPSCGNGNFHLVAWNLLKTNGHYTNKEIVEGVLGFNDINQVRLDTVEKVFGCGIYTPKIRKGDFLQFPDPSIVTTEIPGLIRPEYDLLHTNPPFAVFTESGKRAAKNHTLIRDFIIKGMAWIKEGGYLVFVVPDNWMSYADRNKVAETLMGYQFLWLNIHGAKKWFPKIGSSFTWFVVQKLPAKETFTVDCTYGGKSYKNKVSPVMRPYIPLLYTEEVNSILKKTIDASNPKFKIETTSDLHKYTQRELLVTEKDDKHPHRLIHTPTQTVWASRKHKFQEGWKVFISTTDKYSAFVDNDCGMTQSIAFIRQSSREMLSEQRAKEYEKILSHKLYRFLNNICRWGNFNNIRILQRFPIPTDPTDIYGSFDLTKKEIEFVESVITD